MLRPLFILAFTLGVISIGSAQELWTLERCVQTAKSKSPDVQIALLTARNADLSLNAAQNGRLPILNAGFNLGGQFGYTVDPTTSNFVNSAVGFNSLSMNASVPLYNGGSIKNGIVQAGYDKKAAEADAATISNNLGLSVAQTYLQVLLFEEQVSNAKKRLELSQQNLSRTDKLIAAGSLPANARLDANAQIARDEQNLVNQTNSLGSSWVQLKNLLMVDPDMPMQLEKPTTFIPADVNPDQFGLKPIFNMALSNQPQVIAADYRLKSAQTSIEVAKSALRPNVNLFAGLNSNYSTLGQRILGYNTVFNDITVEVEDIPTVIGFPQTRPVLDKNPYFSQLSQNFGQSAGVNMQIPIFNQRSGRIGVERAELLVQQQQANITRTQQQLKTDIQAAIVNARAARQSLNASQKTFDALKATYENTEKRFQAGNTNSFELLTSKNNLDQAEINLIIARYEYLFRIKIVEFYQGKALKL